MKYIPTALVVVALAITLTGCGGAAPDAAVSPAASASPSACPDVTIVVDFGVLDAPPITACGNAGVAAESVKDAGIATAGTVDWGDQVVCRVNDRPAADETVTVAGQPPFVEACQGMPAATAYWALWVKTAPDAAWEYAQEGLSTLPVAAGESIGLVYTSGTETTPPVG